MIYEILDGIQNFQRKKKTVPGAISKKYYN